MSDNVIPVAAVGDTTRLYFDGGSAFGRPHARPSTTVSTQRTWDDEQLLDAAHLGADGRDLHSDLIVALCTRYVDLAVAENIREADLQAATVRAQDAERQLAIAQGVAAGLELRLAAIAAELAGERAERNRLAALHAEASERLALVTRQRDQAQYERTLALHDRAGTTPAGIAAALDRAARAVTGMGAAELTVELDRQATDERFDRSDVDPADTLVMAVEDMSQEEIRAFGKEVGCG